jgi:dipeptidyl aminopeptidase/acylaminoacyl peptidase
MIHSPRKGRAGFARPAIYATLLAGAVLATATAAPAATTVNAHGPAAKPATALAQGMVPGLGVPVTSAAELRAIAAGNAAIAPAARLPLDALMARAAMREVRFAPDGSTVAFLMQAGHAASLHLYDIASGTTRTLAKEAPRGTLTWSIDGSTLFIDDAAGISAVSAKDGAITKVATFDGKLESKVFNVDLRRPRNLLVGMYDRQAGNYTLFSYGADGSREQLYQGAPLRDAMLDQKGQPLFIKSLAADYTQVISRRDGNGWKEVMRCKPVRPCTMLEAAPDGKRLKMMMGYQDDRTSLVLVDARTGAQRLLHSDPQGIADLRGYAPDPQSGEVLAVGYDLPVRRQYAATPAARRALADIGKRFAGSSISLSAAAGGKRWMVTESRGDLHQPRYWVYDATRREATEILQAERALGKPLPQDALAPKHAISYRASDGMAVHGYLTLPRGADAAKAPLVTMVHGGPWSRFDGEYHWLAQWLANRGVAVFQPNFRASTGYGEKYMLAPGMDFGNGRVQRDIIEGVQWLLANGVGDQSRLAILGDSFGGYATLMALTHTPDMFQFGLAAVPPSDFSRVIELAATENLAGTEDLPTSMRFSQMGISQANAAAMAALRADSPIANTARVKRPLVILAGGKDEKVEIASVNDYVAKLDAAGKPVTLLVDPAEGHNPRKPIVRLAYVNLLERLLHDYLGGPQPEPCTPDLCRYLEQHLKLNNALRK